MLENYKEVVEALEDTNETVITHRVNEILRVLTAFSVMVLPLTLIASLWGMNVGVPGEGDTAAFWIDGRGDGRRAGRDARLLPPPLARRQSLGSRRWPTTGSGRPGASLREGRAKEGDECIFCTKPSEGDDAAP